MLKYRWLVEILCGESVHVTPTVRDIPQFVQRMNSELSEVNFALSQLKVQVTARTLSDVAVDKPFEALRMWEHFWQV